jgi:hypothetical protein
MTMKTLLVTLVIVAAVIAGLLVLSVAVIWALNTLFPVLAIPYTWYTCWATTILLIALRAGSSITTTRS